LAVAAILSGSALMTSLLTVSLNITERMAEELRQYGANILVVPKTDKLVVEIGGLSYSAYSRDDYLEVSTLTRLKEIFWKHNIVGFAPFLQGPVEVDGRKMVLVGSWYEKEIELKDGSRLTTGLKKISPWWEFSGRWVDQADQEAVLGRSLAEGLGVKAGDSLKVGYQGRSYDLKVVGLVSTGGAEEGQIFTDLSLAQRIFSLPGKVGAVQVSALVKPDDKLARRAADNPKRLPPEEYDRWYCSPYISAITYQIEEAIPGAHARPVRQLAEAEAAFLSKLRWIFLLVSVLGLAAVVFAVMATVTSTVLERKAEITLMKVLGAANAQIMLQFMLEAVIAGTLGGLAGFFLGSLLAKVLGKAVFSAAISPSLATLPVVLIMSVGVAVLGSYMGVRQIAKLPAVTGLRNG
jgi:putative ABC transport system permease protein